jgi:hypothetical protein
MIIVLLGYHAEICHGEGGESHRPKTSCEVFSNSFPKRRFVEEHEVFGDYFAIVTSLETNLDKSRSI